MARKMTTVTIVTEGRDKGKIFHIKEMSSHQTASWMTRAVLLLTHAGIDIPRPAGDGKMNPTELMLAAYGALMNVQYEELAPLLDELMRCVTIQPDPRYPNVIRPLIDHNNDGDDIDEYSTRFQLLWEIFKLHTGIEVPGLGAFGGGAPAPPPIAPTPEPLPPEDLTAPKTPVPRARRGQAPGLRR